MSRILNRFSFFILVITLSFTAYSQNITVTELTTGVSASPLANTASNVAILGLEFSKAAGGTNSITAISIVLDQNPVGRFTNPRLVRSDNNSNFDPADLANPVGTPAFGALSINFTGGITTFGNASGAETRRYFVVVDIVSSVNSSTAAVTPSLTQANVTATGTVNAVSITGETYSFQDVITPTFTFNPVNGASGVPVSTNIVITFDEDVFQTDGSAIDAAAIEGGIVELKITNDAGAPVPFTATFNGTNQITIDPDANLSNNTTYYVELNPVEDADGNETAQTSITFTTPDTIAPTVSFNIADGATGVLETTQVIITFTEPVRKLDNSAITPADLNTLVELKLTDNAGVSVPFSATINGSNTIITVTPTGNLTGNTLYYVEMNPVEDASNNATVATSITFTTGDSLPPQVTFNPANGATNVSAVGNITLTFNEPIRNIDDSPITPADIQSGLVELKLTDNAGASVPFTATINVANTVITINPNATLLHSQVYYVEINPVEDAAGNASSAQSITFTTENRPVISGFLPSAGTCIGDNVTVNGFRFTGTGSPASGNTQPTVTVNGVTIPPANIVSFNSAQVVFTLPAGSATGPITIRNNDSDLVSVNSSNLNVFPAINTGLTVTPATFSPAQNTNVNIDVLNTQSSNYSYALILTNAPGGYSLTPPATVHTLTGNSGTRTLNTSEGNPNLDVIGDYTYRIDVSRTGCATRTLTNTPVTLTVASLAVSVSTTSPTNTVCAGSPITLIGSASGGTGFYQFRWTASPPDPTLNSSSSSPTVTPTVNTEYTLEVKDNANNIVTDLVNVTLNPKPVATIIPNPDETAIRVNYVVENRDYLLSGSPAGGDFSGQGTFKKSDGNYYFNPANAGLGTWTIIYTYTNANGCSDTDQVNFIVQALSVNGAKEIYCQSDITDNDIRVNLANAIRPGYQFTRIRFYGNTSPYYYDLPFLLPGATGTPLASGMPPGATYPLSLIDREPSTVNDIQTGLPINLPRFYSLNLDHVRNGWGYGYYYLDVFGKDASGNEVLQSWAFFQVVENGPEPAIIGINELQNICFDKPAISLSSSNTNYAISNFTINPAFSGSISGNQFNPGHNSLPGPGVSERLLTVRMNYSDQNNCPNSVNRNFVWVNKPLTPITEDEEYCQVTDGVARPFTVTGRGNGPHDKPFWYDALAPTVVLDSSNWTFTAPGVTGLAPLVRTYLVRQQYRGCRGDATPVNIEIKPAPSAAFTPPTICELKDFTITGPVDANTLQPYDIYTWDFNDKTDPVIVSNNQFVTHNYASDGLFVIRLKVENDRGCTNEDTRPVTVGINPQPNFTYSLICEGDGTRFIASSNDNVQEFEWDFGDEGDNVLRGDSLTNVPFPNAGTHKRPIHQFISSDPTSSSGVYNVTLTSYTNLGCFASITKPVTILDTLRRTTFNPYLMTDEESGQGYWRIEDVNGNSTWAFGIPGAAKPKMSELTTPAWATGLNTKYNPNEKSFLNSPCFNITGVDRPVVSLNLVLDTDQNREGVALEFSKDGGLTWFPLGGTNSGINWFNTSGFGIGNIGSSPLGWSGGSWTLEDNINRDTLTEARRALDNLANLSLAERSNVRFRFAFATDAFDEYEGFAFNNFNITSRDRISLVENFTNNGSSRYGDNNTVFTNAIPNTEVAKIQYHVGFPNSDSEFEVNTIDPLARAAYYGIPMTDQQIPRSYIDGISDGALDPTNNGIPNLANWATTRFSKQSLKTSDFKVDVESLDASDNSYFKIQAVVTVNTDIGDAKRPVLHLAVVEKTVDQNRFVLRKLVPNAIGHALPVGMSQSDVISIIDSVRIEKPQINVSELAIVAFIQDVNTYEVYQAGIDLNPVFLPDQPTLVTAIEDIAEYIRIYPNPANESFEIELPVKAEHRLTVNLIDPVGRPAQQLYFEKGEQAKTVNTQHLAQGIYVLQIGSGKTGVVRKKVMVVH
ncbi:MAG: Ig-like domain-containing protein [Cyclobacteriaceae bacterium]|nr:Ig-like domain-containing protein [Cyclobacteriaceae bacterium]